MSRRNFMSCAAGAALAAVLSPGAALAQADVIRIVVPIGAGNPFDTGARAMAEGLAKVTGKTVIVDNKPGAGGRIGTSEVARAKPDGLTLLYTTAGHATNAGLYDNLPYDPVKDFTPITIVSKSSGFVLLVQANSPFKNVQDVMAAAKAKPEQISFGSFGNGNTTHIVGAMFAREAKLPLLHVPYKGSPLSDFFGGHVNMVFMGTSTVIPLLKDGRVRALAVSSPEPDPDLPGVPTFRQLGYEDVDVPAWAGVLAPRGMSDEQVQTLYKQIGEAVRQKPYQDNLKLTSGRLAMVKPEDFKKQLQAEVTRFKKELPALGIKGD